MGIDIKDCLFGLCRKVFDLVGDHSKSLAGIPGTGGLDRGVQCQHFRLIGNAFDDVDNLADFTGRFRQAVHRLGCFLGADNGLSGNVICFMDTVGNAMARCLQFLGRGCDRGNVAAGDFRGGGNAFDQLRQFTGITFHGLRHIVGAPGLKADFGNDVIGFAFDDLGHRLDFRGCAMLGDLFLLISHQTGHISHQNTPCRIIKGG